MEAESRPSARGLKYENSDVSDLDTYTMRENVFVYYFFCFVIKIIITIYLARNSLNTIEIIYNIRK